MAVLRSSGEDPSSQAARLPTKDTLDSNSRSERYTCPQTLTTVGETSKDPPASSLFTEPLIPKCTSRQQRSSGGLQTDLPTGGATSGEPSTAEPIPNPSPARRLKTLLVAVAGFSKLGSVAGGTKRIIIDSTKKISDSNEPLSPGEKSRNVYKRLSVINNTLRNGFLSPTSSSRPGLTNSAHWTYGYICIALPPEDQLANLGKFLPRPTSFGR
jgi:hypothetical protein